MAVTATSSTVTALAAWEAGGLAGGEAVRVTVSAGVAAGISADAVCGDDGTEGAGGIEWTAPLQPAANMTTVSSATTGWRWIRLNLAPGLGGAVVLGPRTS
jgi:hypothetical protein